MNYLILGKVVGGHVVVLIGLLINHFIKNHDNSFAQKSKPIPMRVVTTAPPPAPPPVVAPKPPPKKPEVKKPEPKKVVQKPKPKPKPPPKKPEVKKPEPKKVVKKVPAEKPKPKPVVREPDPEPVPIVQKTPTPEELFAELQKLVPTPPKPVTKVQPHQPQQRPPIQRPQVRKVVPPNASQLNALQNRVEQECLARSWSINKPNRIIQNLTAIAVARVHRDGRVTFAGFKLHSGDRRMDEAVKLTIDRAGCRFPLPANAPDFVDLSIEFELNP